ncbi:hypothetical protein [Acinetobacter indicus]|uniref:hypothetical protein n=1 Tax=Acinetobacter indicus TaxID=756892 RepID=UPI0009491F65|nr:hypothetical protein [Acinetobacter indicus]
MAMKQTQTKVFKFADVDLDLTPASKIKLPIAFKKILSSGYNTQIVSSVSVSAGNVTLSYGVSHGYVAGRVLKVNAPELLSINGGEFVIDSVTDNTVSLTIDDAPSLITGGFTTLVAPLGWQLCYESESTFVHLYKLKNLNGSELYCRMVFSMANGATARSMIQATLGHTADESTGVITDQQSSAQGLTNTKIDNNSGSIWKLAKYANSTHNNFTHAQGLSLFQDTVIIGSQFHLLGLITYNSDNKGFFGFAPAATLSYEKLNYPVNFASTLSAIYSEDAGWYLNNNNWNINGIKVIARPYISTGAAPTHTYPTANASYLPNNIDGFETSIAYPIELFEASTTQFLGFVSGGLYRWAHSSSNLPGQTELPKLTTDVDFNNPIYIHNGGFNGPSSSFWFVAPVEEIRIEG